MHGGWSLISLWYSPITCWIRVIFVCLFIKKRRLGSRTFVLERRDGMFPEPHEVDLVCEKTEAFRAKRCVVAGGELLGVLITPRQILKSGRQQARARVMMAKLTPIEQG
jgi:hypothetical protein